MAFLERRDLLECQVGSDQQRLPRQRTLPLHELLDPRLREPEDRHQPLQRVPYRVPRSGQDGQRVARDVLRDDPAVAVEDRAPRRWDRERAQAVRLRLEHVGVAAQDLRLEEAVREHTEPGEDHGDRSLGAPPSRVEVKRLHRLLVFGTGLPAGGSPAAVSG